MFKIQSKLGLFQITFGGITLSAGLGPTHYCEAQCKTRVDGCFESANIEIAFLDSDSGAWMTREIWKEVFGDESDDDVVGWVTPEQFAQLVSYLNERTKK